MHHVAYTLYLKRNSAISTFNRGSGYVPNDVFYGILSKRALDKDENNLQNLQIVGNFSLGGQGENNKHNKKFAGTCDGCSNR